MKRLMYATDFSEKSQKAFRCAVETAKKFNADIVVTHIYQMPKLYRFPYLNYTFISDKENSERNLKKLREIMDDYFQVDDKSINVTYRIIRDTSAIRGILTAIEEEDPDLLMLSAQGDNESYNYLFGGMIKTLVKQTSLPVMTIPDSFKIPDFSKIAFASNLYPSEVMAIKEMIALLKPIDSEIHLVHVNRGGDTQYELENFQKMVKEQIGANNLKFVILNEDKVFEALNDYVIKNNIGLLSMTEKEHGGLFYRFFHQDLVHKMEFSSTIPVLSFNENSLVQLKEEDVDVMMGHGAL